MTAEVVPSPTSLSVAFETSTSIFAAGCWTSISLSMVAPSLVMVTSPSESTSILSMPRGPTELLTISAISFAAWMLFLWASLPLDWLLPSFRMRTGVPPEVMAGIAVVDIFSYNTTAAIQLRVVYKKFGLSLARSVRMPTCRREQTANNHPLLCPCRLSFGTTQSYVALAIFAATYAALILRNVRRTVGADLADLPGWGGCHGALGFDRGGGCLRRGEPSGDRLPLQHVRPGDRPRHLRRPGGLRRKSAPKGEETPGRPLPELLRVRPALDGADERHHSADGDADNDLYRHEG